MSEPTVLSHSAIPPVRVRAANERRANPRREFVLYWMTAFRRTRFNFALQRAVEWSTHFGKPLLVLEALRVDYPWASDRLHRFVMDGMMDNASACASAGVTYYPYVEPSHGAGEGLLTSLAARACVVVTDDYPAFFLPAALRAGAARVDVTMEAVDSNGLHALQSPKRAFETAFAFRRWLQNNILENLVAMPAPDPLTSLPPGRAIVPSEVLRHWPAATPEQLASYPLESLPIDHTVAVAPMRGGSAAAATRIAEFIPRDLSRYAEERNQPSREATSRLSPYLHFGHISAHEAFTAVARAEGWSIDRINPEVRGKRSGFWGMSISAESFVDQLVTWRELGFNFCAYRRDFDRFESLPAWARATLERHERDPRPQLYSMQQLEQGETSDVVWNAAQTQLVRAGVIQNYLRMLWAKRILEWTRSPRDALDVMIHLNNKYALDGRDPNSYSGILWTLGRYDRPWGPERPIFGTVRYMSSANASRKLKLGDYLSRYGTGVGA